MRLRRFALPLSALLFCAVLSAQKETALDRYVNAKDPVYAWKLVKTIPGEGYRTDVLELTSQTWRTEKDVDRPVWKHWLSITRPDKVTSNKALLFIGGGKNGDPAPAKSNARSVRIATETKSIVADLGMVPNQPLFFTDSPEKGRSEDDAIAYSRVKHFTTKDDTWLIRLAMVKSGVRAMDAIQEFSATEAGGKTKIDNFVVAGGSKRGWTTWLVGAVDKRVVAIMPMVIDALNSEVITRHHFEAYGFFSSALGDYVRHGLFPAKIGTPEYKAVLDIEDPYNYLDRPQMKMPKFLINASGDQFFLPDNSHIYYDKVKEEKHIRYVPNVKHNLEGGDATDSMLAFYQAILTNTPRPKFTWKIVNGSIVVNVHDKPADVTLWQANNPEARDFRLDVIGKAYKPTKLTEEKKGVYVAQVAKPEKGFTAFYVELTYPGPAGTSSSAPFKFTTEVIVVPDVLPFKWEDAAKKYPAKSGGGN